MHTDHCEVQYVIRRSTAGGCRFAHKLQTRLGGVCSADRKRLALCLYL